MHTSFFRHFIITVLLSAGVYLFMSYLLPYLFPFLFAYILMRMLLPIMEYLHNVCKFPRLFSHYGTLILFFVSICTLIATIIYKGFCQIRLLITNLPVYEQYLCSFLQSRCYAICHCIDTHFELSLGTARSFLSSQLETLEKSTTTLVSKNVWKFLLCIVSQSFHILAVLFIIGIAMFILVHEIEPLHASFRKSRYYAPVHFILKNVKKSGLTYLKTEGIILLLNCLVCSLAFFLIHNPYFFLLGIIIAIFDAFPILGSGMVLLPWGLFFFISKDYLYASILLTAYVITLLIREILEAKLLGNGMQLNSFIMLAAIFIGIELFGISGILLGPLSLVLIRSLMQLALP